MIKRHTVNTRLVTVLFLVGLLLGAALVAVIAFSHSPALAQTAGVEGEEGAEHEANDAAEGPDMPITGTALQQASAAALQYIGEGRVTETEVGDEEGYYEVEITRPDGRQVDVHLDEAFKVLGHEDD